MKRHTIAILSGALSLMIAVAVNAQKPTNQKVALITGATDGLGKAVALTMAKNGYALILHGRNESKLNAVRDELTSRNPSIRVTTELADFESLAQVDCMARRVAARYKRIDVMINNAGIGKGHANRQRALSQDGYEAMFAVNYLAAFHLTEQLLPVMKSSAPSTIIHVASIGQHEIDFKDPHLAATGAFEGQRAYGQSKLAQIMHATDLAGQLNQHRVTVNSVHPGTLMPTKLAQDGWGASMDSLETGVESVMRLANAASLDNSGLFYNRSRVSRPLAQAQDAGARKQLRELSLKLVQTALAEPKAKAATAKCEL
jgi:NAD(P)-dependent dehydrogenase (short-subunit alcohol dehydrogenase family)